MTYYPDLEPWKEGDRDWAARFINALQQTSLTPEQIEETVASTLATTRESELDAHKLFGTPERAAQVAEHQETTSDDRSGSRIFTLTEALSSSLMLLGFLFFILTWFSTDYSSWKLSAPYNLFGAGLLALIFALVSPVCWFLITRAQTAAAVGILCLGAGVAGLVIPALSRLYGAENQPVLPMYLGLLVAVIIGVAGVLIAIGGGWASAGKNSRTDRRDWFTQLEGYLRSHQTVPKNQAREIVAAAYTRLAHLQAEKKQTIDPKDVYGSARAYAQSYAASSFQLLRRKAVLRQIFAAIQWLIFLGLAVFLTTERGWVWLTILLPPVVAAFYLWNVKHALEQVRTEVEDREKNHPQ